MDKTTFVKTAKPVNAADLLKGLVATPKKFSTGSVGYNINGKVAVVVDGVALMLQVSGNCVVHHSKDWPELPAEAYAQPKTDAA